MIIELSHDEAILMEALLYCHATGSVLGPRVYSDGDMQKYKQGQEIAFNLMNRVIKAEEQEEQNP